MSTTRGNDIKLLALCLVGGPALLGWGLRALRKKRILENTPRSKARSAAIGMVELAGVAHPKRLHTSPVTQLPCCWWSFVIEEHVRRGNSSHWVAVQSACSPDPFYLEDGSGRVLVDPADAEYWLHETILQDQLFSPARVAPILSEWGINASGFFAGSRRFRLRERIIPPLSQLFVFGELAQACDHLAARRIRFQETLRQAKADPARMREADADHDGAISAEEWEALRRKLEQEFLESEATAEKIIVRKPSSGDQPFIISNELEPKVTRKLAWLGSLAVLGGIAVDGGGVAMGIGLGYSRKLMLVCAAAGIVVGWSIGLTKLFHGGRK